MTPSDIFLQESAVTIANCTRQAMTHVYKNKAFPQLWGQGEVPPLRDDHPYKAWKHIDGTAIIVVTTYQGEFRLYQRKNGPDANAWALYVITKREIVTTPSILLFDCSLGMFTKNVKLLSTKELLIVETFNKVLRDHYTGRLNYVAVIGEFLEEEHML